MTNIAIGPNLTSRGLLGTSCLPGSESGCVTWVTDPHNSPRSVPLLQAGGTTWDISVTHCHTVCTESGELSSGGGPENERIPTGGSRRAARARRRRGRAARLEPPL